MKHQSEPQRSTLDRQIDRVRASQITGAALTALVGLLAAYLIVTFDTAGNLADALVGTGHQDVDIAIAVLAFAALRVIDQWKADARELRQLRLQRPAEPPAGLHQ